jgi:hypothetical protein
MRDLIWEPSLYHHALLYIYPPLSYDNGALDSLQHDAHRTRPATQRLDLVPEASSARMIKPL